MREEEDINTCAEREACLFVCHSSYHRGMTRFLSARYERNFECTSMRLERRLESGKRGDIWKFSEVYCWLDTYKSMNAILRVFEARRSSAEGKNKRHIEVY